VNDLKRNKMKIYVLVENHENPDPEIGAEHGLSMFFEYEGKRFLFDCGSSGIFARNAERLGIGLNDIDFVVFSHGHWDHTGGFKALNLPEKTRIVAHPDFLKTRRSGKNGLEGFEFSKEKMVLTKRPKRLTENVWFLGEIPVKEERDYLFDDSAMAIKKGNEAIVLSGCAHSGIENIVKYASRLLSPERITIIGGFHMWNFSEEKTRDVIKVLKENHVQIVYPGHCTGEKAEQELLESFKGKVLCSGKIIEV
jgi:7,8-dihydropterin-6-yl-methyl-4-(beta-D-ribofuranosyl)aminobenzene 5'-phosphate synthase